MRKLRIAFLLTVLLSLLAGYILSGSSGQGIDEKAYLEEIAPFIKFHEKRGSPPYYPSDSGIIAFNSYDIRPDIRGYAGPIKLLIAIDKDGIIRGLKILEHRETKNYVHYMERPEYLSQFIGRSVRDPLEIDRDIDGISRATVSVEALARTVRESSRLMASEVFHIEVPEDGGASHSSVPLIVYSVLFISSIIFYYLSARKKNFLRFRDLFLISGIFIVGLYLSSPFSIIHIYNLLLQRWSSSLFFYIFVITVLLSILVAGRFYCGWLCPFGALSEFAGRLPLKKWSIPYNLDLPSRRLKYIMLFLTTALVLITGVPEFGLYETYLTLFSFHGNILQWSLVAVMVLANLRVRRFWCRYLCPAGAFIGLFSRGEKGYNGSQDCPVENLSEPPSSECIRCQRCLRSYRNV